MKALPHSPFAAGDQTDSLAVDPQGRFLYVANLDSKNISAFRIDPGTGVPAPVVGSPFRSGRLVSLVIDAKGRFLYGCDDSGTYRYQINGSTGALTDADRVPFGGQALALDPGGALLYSADGQSMSAYEIQRESGKLKHIQPTKMQLGDNAEFIAIDPAGQFIYGTSGLKEMAVFQFHRATGAFERIYDSSLVPSGLATSIVFTPAHRPALGLPE